MTTIEQTVTTNRKRLSVCPAAGMIQPRNCLDVGTVTGKAAMRYIKACDYETNAEYVMLSREVLHLLPWGPTGSVIVEVGCGPGTLCSQIQESAPAAQVIGVDGSQDMIEHARRKYPGLVFCCADAEMLPFERDSADAVVCVNSLHHFSQLDVAFQEMLRVLKPGGIGYVSDLRRDAHPGAIQSKLKRMNSSVAGDLCRSIASAFVPAEVIAALDRIGAQDAVAFDGAAVAHLWGPLPHDPFDHAADLDLYYRAAFRKRDDHSLETHRGTAASPCSTPAAVHISSIGIGA